DLHILSFSNLGSSATRRHKCVQHKVLPPTRFLANARFLLSPETIEPNLGVPRHRHRTRVVQLAQLVEYSRRTVPVDGREVPWFNCYAVFRVKSVPQPKLGSAGESFHVDRAILPAHHSA